MTRFDLFVQIVLVEEGPLSDDAWDPGGLTKYGIAQNEHPELDVENLTRDQAIAVYKVKYWDEVRADDLPAPLDIAVADCAVNEGVHVAIELLQDAARVTTDGVMGPVTIAGAKAHMPDIVPDFFARRGVAYSHLGGFAHDGHGWLNRCFKLAMTLALNGISPGQLGS